MKFITNEPALVLDGTLVVGDLHLGIETEFYKSGFMIPSNIKKIGDRILKMAMENNCKKLILLGDVKHDYHGVSWQEEREIPKFLKKISKRLEVHVTLGNHDGNLRQLAPKKVHIHPTSGFRSGTYFFNHGQSWPGKEFLKTDLIFLGHSHPAIEFRDSLGFRSIEPCWLRCKLDRKKIQDKYKERGVTKEAVVVPAFNPLVGGLPVNRGEGELGPMMKNKVIRLTECDAYLLDGTYLGKVKSL
ncbi:MAG: metallophosphoesterase [archaeon]|nr:MAG: metallophosphoesterase [archaeon]